MDDGLDFSSVVGIYGSQTNEYAFRGKSAPRTETAVDCFGEFNGDSCLGFVNLPWLDCY